MDRKCILAKNNRIVVKAGTRTLTDENLRLDEKRIGNLVRQTMALKKEGHEVIIVSSGAIAAGISQLGLKHRPKDINTLQACAAVGQSALMKKYDDLFAKSGQKTGQVLLTRDDFADRARFLNLRNTFNALLKMGVVPIINENDSVAVAEIKFGDNDTLAAQTAVSLEADLLIMLSSTDGLHTQDPTRTKKATPIRTVQDIKEVEKLAEGKSRHGGVGGIKSKLEAAKITMKAGIPLVFVDGNAVNVILKAASGEEVGTLFVPAKEHSDRDVWMRFSGRPKGKVSVDEGAKKALLSGGKSLLPSGVTGVEGSFKKGDLVSVADERGCDFARGIINLGRKDADKIKGAQTKDIKALLGETSKKEVIHHDNIILL
ncbi:Glutamate 5-kinase [uncultured archaeon]|nr:Glutamate 5-kinase [uncultured archaeon]